MKINKTILVMIYVVSFLFVGCSNINNNSKNINIESLKDTEESYKDNLNGKDIENHIPYIDEYSDEIDDSVINERYKNVKKEELTYDSIGSNRK